MAQRLASWGTKLVSKTTSGTLGRLCEDGGGARGTLFTCRVNASNMGRLVL